MIVYFQIHFLKIVLEIDFIMMLSLDPTNGDKTELLFHIFLC